ncbi:MULTISPECIES: S41 family peptidase [Brevibacillus]|uniref:S41 family peptidase n=1 Tax=Brevibacillus TaxID=55080 RepID=UPI0002403E82|nr:MULTISPECIES: S41 family peptidase [Brevibacillus]AUM66943.1 PDZ domain-containing protein [Brevibacillus laterosporus]AYK05801.1 PDZ domain-containing protein [Brevibacillus laterosporus]ERM17142.1 peptidase S41 [Brevibacillus laterosporus PE36]MBA4531903.1 S41 family peptidase [Brevibacillus halotolerans]MCR8962994.1 S41 family peptidase [Brevibacillus laterosporus]
MKWNGRKVLALVLAGMLTSSLLTVIAVKTVPLSSATNAVVAGGSNGLFSLGGGQGSPKDFAKLQEVYKIIKSRYVHEVADDKLMEGAINGMISALDDPYSDYMDPEAAAEFNASLNSSFEGIGAEVTMKNGKLTIVSPIKTSPAEKAGLRPNDQVLSVNGESLEGLDLHKAVGKIRGPKGTKATLKILRTGNPEPITVVIVRDDIPIETVHSSILESNGKKIGKLEMTSFASATADDFNRELAELEKKGIQGLIIDVRGNPGGYLKATTSISEVLIPNKAKIVEISYGNNNEQIETFYSKADKGKPYPITVLIDGGSASASEILAGALSESAGAKLVGEKTFGKGTVQNTMEMKDKSQLKLTIAKWLTPKGEWIHKKGIQPDEVVTQPDYFKATQLPHDKVLSRDMNGIEVKNLQLILEGLQLKPDRLDGYYDASTEAAVKKFQQAHKLEVTGKVDQKTGLAMQNALIKVMRDPNNDRQLQRALEITAQSKAK